MGLSMPCPKLTEVRGVIAFSIIVVKSLEEEDGVKEHLTICPVHIPLPGHIVPFC